MLYNSHDLTSVICLYTLFYLIHRSGPTILGQSGPGSNRNEGVLHIPQIFKAGTSPSDCLISYPEHSL